MRRDVRHGEASVVCASPAAQLGSIGSWRRGERGLVTKSSGGPVISTGGPYDSTNSPRKIRSETEHPLDMSFDRCGHILCFRIRHCEFFLHQGRWPVLEVFGARVSVRSSVIGRLRGRQWRWRRRWFGHAAPASGCDGTGSGQSHSSDDAGKSFIR